MKIIFIVFSLLLFPMAHAEDCTFQADYYSSLPIFMGVEGTLEFTSRGLKVIQRGSGLRTKNAGKVTRYDYPSERKEAFIRREEHSPDEVTVTAIPRLFDCNLREVRLKKNKVQELTTCNPDGCRQFTKKSCEYLVREITPESVKNPQGIVSKVEGFLENESNLNEIKARFEEMVNDSVRLLRLSTEHRNFSPSAQLNSNDGALPALAALGKILEERAYCSDLLIGNAFYQEDHRPSKYLPKTTK